MTHTTKQSDGPGEKDNCPDAIDARGRPDNAEADTPQVAPPEVAGQKHLGPAGRHSQQTHRRAAERAAALGLSSEREQHDYDRSMVLEEMQKIADRKAGNQKRVQSQQNTPPKETA